MELYGVKLIGLNDDTARRVLMTLALVGLVVLLRYLVVVLVSAVTNRDRNRRLVFWTRQGSSLAALLLILAATLSIWFDNSARLTTAAGFATAGLAIAAQRAVTAFAGYLVIMRGKTFTVGDRIRMGGVRGDVIALGFLQTRILEMGQPPDVNEQEEPGMWVRARQYSGRIVTVTNDKVFDEPIYNFTREFPYIWEEISLGIGYHADRARAERILLDAANEQTARVIDESRSARAAFEARYDVHLDRQEPHVYWRLTDNWLELTVRFLVAEHGIREIKDAMTRAILPQLEAAGLEIASTSIAIADVPPLRITRQRNHQE